MIIGASIHGYFLIIRRLSHSKFDLSQEKLVTYQKKTIVAFHAPLESKILVQGYIIENDSHKKSEPSAIHLIPKRIF